MSKLWFLMVVLVAGCESTPSAVVDASSDASASSDAAFSGVCTWPTKYDITDAGWPSCAAKRYGVECDQTAANGSTSTESCLKDTSELECAGDPSFFTDGGVTCKSLCHDDEYTVQCNEGSQGGKMPASTCRSTGPFGAGFYCCPCDGG